MRLAVLLTVVAAWAAWAASAACSSQNPAPQSGPEPRAVRLAGRTVDEDGAPVAGAMIAAAGKSAQSGADGRFALEGVPEGAQLVVAAAPGRHTDVLAVVAAPQDPGVELVLASAADSVDLAFTGDVAWQRRDGASASGFAARVAAAAPLVATADIGVVPLESVLGGSGVPHPTRAQLINSPGDATAALVALGADIVVLANDHAYDFLDDGLVGTLDRLRNAGLTPLGAGADDREAYAPVVVEKNGVRVGIAAFSGLTGRAEETAVHEPPFFDATTRKAGVARMDVRRIDAALADLRGRADRIVVVLHGGREHDAAPAIAVATAARRAIDDGADLVIAHHARSFAGIEVYKDRMVVYGLGPLVFDDPHADGARGAVLRVRLPKSGAPVVRLLPLVIDDLVPAAAAGSLARAIVETVAARSAVLGVTVTPDGRVLPLSPDSLQRATHEDSVAVPATAGAGATHAFEEQLTPATYLSRVEVLAPSASTLWLGRDVLGGGDLEDLVADGRFAAPVGWRFPSDSEQIVADDTGGLALSVCRSGTARDTAAATTRARFPVAAGGSFSLCGCWRGDAGAVGAASVAFYDTLDEEAGPLDTRDAVSGASPATWSCFCGAVSGPAASRYAAVRVSHTPSADATACIRFDRLRLVEWEAQPEAAASLAVPNEVAFVRVTGVGSATSASLAYTLTTLELP